MKFLLNVVVCYLCLKLTLSVKDTYKAAVVSTEDLGLDRYAPLIAEAAKSNADILVLQSNQNSISGNSVTAADYYDEAVKTISSAAKEGGLYVVAHLLEKTRCQNKDELIRSNLVFDRRGSVVSVYRKSVNNVANCTTGSSDLITFTTDFGVRFGLLMEEDLVLQSLKRAQSLKNFVVAGSWSSEIPFLSAPQFSSSWAFVTNANLVSSAGIYAGKAGISGAGTKVVLAELRKDGGLERPTTPVVTPTKVHTFPGEDLSQYIIRPLDLEASIRGYTETVCHGKFCCEFEVKTSSAGSSEASTGDLSYGLAVFDGARHFGGSHNIGVQTCAVFACAGHYKRSCAIGSEHNSTNIHFDRVTIRSNFTKPNSAQFPVILTAARPPVNFKFDRSVKSSTEVTVEITNSNKLLGFGIFGRDYLKDFEVDYGFVKNSDSEGLTSDIYDYLYNEDVQEFFDYVWIRLRILIFVVSIYILEML